MNCCGGCGGKSRDVELTELELALLHKLAVSPFLPLCRDPAEAKPVYITEESEDPYYYSLAVSGLKLKGIIRGDYDIPIAGYPYSEYGRFSVHGSMALTRFGQETLELIDILGIE